MLKITKASKLLETNNECCHNFYYIVHGKILNDEMTRSLKIKAVIWFDIFELQEYCENESMPVNNTSAKSYAKEYFSNMIGGDCVDLDDRKRLVDVVELCNATITEYNSGIHY